MTIRSGPLSRREGAVDRVFKLRDVPLFAELGAEELLPVAEIATERRFEAGEVVFAEGDEAAHLFLIASGSVEVRRGDRRLAELGAGETFGVMALFGRTQRSASVRALVRTHVLVIARDDMNDVLELYPSVGRSIARELARRLRAVNAGITEDVPLTEG